MTSNVAISSGSRESGISRKARRRRCQKVHRLRGISTARRRPSIRVASTLEAPLTLTSAVQRQRAVGVYSGVDEVPVEQRKHRPRQNLIEELTDLNLQRGCIGQQRYDGSDDDQRGKQRDHRRVGGRLSKVQRVVRQRPGERLLEQDRKPQTLAATFGSSAVPSGVTLMQKRFA